MTDEQPRYVREWISESVEFFRRLGFFSSEPEFEDWRMEYFEKHLPGTEEGEYEFLDRLLLGVDKKRVWSKDWEVLSDAIAEHKQAVERWAEIPRGAFEPKDLRVEVDEAVSGVFTVSFEHNGEGISRRVHGMGWLDPLLLVKTNELISDTGVQFCALDTGDQSAFIVALEEDERGRIESARGWDCIEI